MTIKLSSEFPFVKFEGPKHPEYLSNPALLPLVIGITGHRDIFEIDNGRDIREELKGWIVDNILSKHPKVPVWLVTPLATGADQLAAEVVLNLQANDYPIGVQAVLPMAKDHYIEDFEEASDVLTSKKPLQDFENLIARVSAQRCGLFGEPIIQPTAVKGRYVSDIEREQLRSYPADSIKDTDSRVLQYQAVGRYMARRCHLLIALWNGDSEEPIKKGGTRALIQERLEGIPVGCSAMSRILRDDIVDSQPVLWIQANRISKPRAESKSASGEHGDFLRLNEKRQPVADERQDCPHREMFEDTLKKLEEFNRQALQAQASSMNSKINCEDPCPNCDGTLTSQPNDRWNEIFRVADHNAVSQKASSVKARKVIAILAIAIPILSLLMKSLFASSFDLTSALGFISLLAALSITGIAYWLTRKRHQQFVINRIIAETVRIQYFWRLAGVDESVGDNFARRQYEDLGWIATTLRALSLTGPIGDPLPTAMDCATDHWIEHQLNFQNKRELRNRANVRKWRRLELGLLWIAGIASLIVLILIFSELTNPESPVVSFVQDVVVMLPAFAAVGAAYAAGMAFKEQSTEARLLNRFHRTTSEFLNGRNPAPTTAEKIAVIKEIGLESLRETADWMSLQRSRRPKSPVATEDRP